MPRYSLFVGVDTDDDSVSDSDSDVSTESISTVDSEAEDNYPVEKILANRKNGGRMEYLGKALTF